ncbi:hypothetical protein [Fodinibius sp. Rm-B-1B1-1]|uniref:hypothetical protein n=1 Tax=Fodinibius alkaliphilus TaxID=3140241 RepID=UPI00315A14AD
MKNLFRQYFTKTFLILFLAGGLVACGGSGEEESANEKSQATAETDTTSAPTEKLNINTASGDQFRTIPNVGDKMVHEFEEYRPYVSIQQFRKEIGKYVDESQVAAYEEYIFVPIHRNDSDVSTLTQIPGLDESAAQEIASQRPFDTNEAFFEALSSVVDEQQLATAKSYMKAE